MWADFCMKKSKPVTYTAVLTDITYVTQCELDIQIVLKLSHCIRDILHKRQFQLASSSLTSKIL